MSQKTLEKLNQKPLSLKEEIKSFRSFIIGTLGKDQEGEYKPEFIHKALQAAREKTKFIFKNRKFFLKQIKKI
jgi:hypothetical protein